MPSAYFCVSSATGRIQAVHRYPRGYRIGWAGTQDDEENIVCRAVTCRQCGKTTWSGCGQHVDSVMAGVPSSDRCRGHESTPGFFARLFGKG